MIKTNWIICAILTAFTLTSLSGCGFIADGPFGWAYTNSKTAVAVGPAKTGSKSGKACVKGYFGMLTVGDASIETAMKTVGIKEVYTVSQDNYSFFGMYTSQCTVVTGETEIASAEPAKKEEAAKPEEPAKKEEPAKESK